ncbi:MAG TPA: hypothetical protein P5543_09050 [Planctomycetota bacterium]|nr:hypothetical protein [Planctomycetota bacterium]
MLWGGKLLWGMSVAQLLCSVALGRQFCSGVAMLLGGGKFALGWQCCSGEVTKTRRIM